jgi:hypothetical protein
MKNILVCAVMVFVLAGVSLAGGIPVSSPLAWTPSNVAACSPVYGSACYGASVLGTSFTTNTALSVNALGSYDVNILETGGFVAPETVGIYNSVGTLLVSTTVTTADPVVSGFYMQSIAPYALAPGTYTEVSTADINDHGFSFTVPPATYPGITFNAGCQGVGGPCYNVGYYGPNFSVPEPSLLLMLGTGLAGVMGMVGAARRKLI